MKRKELPRDFGRIYTMQSDIFQNYRMQSPIYILLKGEIHLF